MDDDDQVKGQEETFHGGFRQSMAWLHTWAGLVLSLLLYFVFITGSFGYFNTEITHWMQPEMPHLQAELNVAEQSQAALDHLQRVAPDASRYLVRFPSERANGAIRVFANLKTPDAKGARNLNQLIDPDTGSPIEARSTGGGNALYRMHYALHYIPYQAAVYTVGVATLFMLLAIFTGIVTHKKILADFFTLRVGKGQRSWLDAHNMSSVLALPFMLMITYSGLVFYTFQYSPGVAVLSLGAEQETFRTLNRYLYPRIENPQATGDAAQMVPVAGPLETAQALWPDARLRFLQINHPGDAAATLSIGRWPEGIARRGEILYFDAVSGELHERMPAQPPSSVFASATMSLHEGHFADYYLRWLYFLSGLLGAAMIATGSLLWAKKRRNQYRGRPPRSIRFVERANLGTIVGLPLGCAAYFWANRLLPVGLDERAAWELHCLFVVWALSFMHAGARELRCAWREQVGLLAGLFMALPLLNALTTDVHLGVTLGQGDWVRAGFDLSALVFGVALLFVRRRLPAPEPRSQPIIAMDSLPSPKIGG
ncbi:MAG: PepSY-associated TM helix domain-containing protein [Pseudomonadota bacterium]